MTALAPAPVRRYTFEEFLELGPKKSEFRDGVIWVNGSPWEGADPLSSEAIEAMATSDVHDSLTGYLRAFFEIWCRRTGYGRTKGETFTMRVGERGYSPDVHVYATHREAQFSRMFALAPCDLAVEVLSPSTTADDKGAKFDAYEAAGVREYWILDPSRRVGMYFAAVDGVFRPFVAEGGILRSRALPGLTIREEGLWDGSLLTDVGNAVGPG